METYTTQPGVQLYTGNYLDHVTGKDAAVYNQHSHLCLETQNYPDAINHVSAISKKKIGAWGGATKFQSKRP